MCQKFVTIDIISVTLKLIREAISSYLGISRLSKRHNLSARRERIKTSAYRMVGKERKAIGTKWSGARGMKDKHIQRE